MDTNPGEKIIEGSMDRIIASIRSYRDRQIDELMIEPNLVAFLEHYYDTVVISKVKKEFLLKDLIELKKSSLDLSHYSSLIKRMKDTTTFTVNTSHKSFLSELQNIFQKYVSKG
jgi:hypothetical protein